MITGLSQFQRLNFLGVGVGGIVPGLVVCAANSIQGFLPERFWHAFIGILLAFIGLFSLIVFLGWLAESRQNSKYIRVLLNIGAVGSVIFLGGFVITTGGPFLSPFSFHFLYIPVVVGRCLSVKEMKTACIGCGIAFLSCTVLDRWLVFHKLQLAHDLSEMGSKISYLIAYVCIFALQLWITYILSSEQDSSGQGPTPQLSGS